MPARGAATSAIETQDRGPCRPDRGGGPHRRRPRPAPWDTAIEEAAKRGKTNAALSAIEEQRKARASLVDERNHEAGTLAALKAEPAGVAAKGRRVETEAAPIRYVAELVGAGTDSERAIQWLIALIVLCCDPLAMR
jgi:hypothetical protein